MLIGTFLFALSGCNTQESKDVIETQAVREAQEVTETEDVEAVESAEEVKEVKKVENTKLILRINCGAAEPYTDNAGNTWLADQAPNPAGNRVPSTA